MTPPHDRAFTADAIPSGEWPTTPGQLAKTRETLRKNFACALARSYRYEGSFVVAETDGAMPPTQTLTVDRTAVQVFLLNLATFNVYSAFYLIYSVRASEQRLGQRPWPTFVWIGLFFPILNVIVTACGYAKLEKQVRSAGVVPRIPFPLEGALLSTLALASLLPLPYWFLAFSPSLVLAHIQSVVRRADRRANPGDSRPKLSTIEVIILFVGLSLVAATVLVRLIGAGNRS
jgi:hypothetical protein